MSVDLVVARFNENIQWLHDVSPSIRIIVYDKSVGIRKNNDYKSFKSRLIVHTLPNVGRETDTYLNHIIRYYDDMADTTIFCQGYPFVHSPQFLGLIRPECIARYSDIQTLSCQFMVDRGMPPAHIVAKCTDLDILGFHAALYPYSTYTLDHTWYADEGIPWIYKNYLSMFNLPNGTNIIKHLFDEVGLKTDSEVGDVAYICISALFAVAKARVTKIPLTVYENIKRLNLTNSAIGYVMERAWMTIFGYKTICL